MTRSEDRLTAAFLLVALVALFGGVLTGFFQAIEHAGVDVYPSTPIVKSYYHSLTLHGVLNVLVWTTFFICGFVPFLVTRPIYAGAGKVGAENQTSPAVYQISQRFSLPPRRSRRTGPSTWASRSSWSARGS